MTSKRSYVFYPRSKSPKAYDRKYKAFNKNQDLNLIMSLRKLRSQRDLLIIPSVTTVSKGQSSLRYYKTLFWNTLPYDIRNAGALELFKGCIRKQKPNDWPRRMFKAYLNSVGYIEVYLS